MMNVTTVRKAFPVDRVAHLLLTIQLFRLGADNLCALHVTAERRVEGVAAVHDAAVVPHDHIAVAPFVRPFEGITGSVIPNDIEQFLALIDLHPNDPRIETPSQEQTFSPCLRMGAHQWVTGPR